MAATTMTFLQVVELLGKKINPDYRILLADGEFFIEHSSRQPLHMGSGVLIRHCPEGMPRPNNLEDLLGFYKQREDGKWESWRSQGSAIVEQSDCVTLGIYQDRDAAIAALWLSRFEIAVGYSS
jgi:hypothetical protein